MGKKRRRSARKGGGDALLPAKRARRKPAFTLTPEQVLKECKAGNHELFCAGQVLVVMDLMVAEGWPVTELSTHSHVSKSHLSAFLRMESLLTSRSVVRIARAFGLKTSEFDDLSERKVGS